MKNQRKIEMKTKKILHLTKKGFFSAIFSTGFVIMLIRAAYYYFKDTETIPWDSDLVIIITKWIWNIVSYSIPVSMFLLVLLIISAYLLGLYFQINRGGTRESNKYPQFFRKWKNLYWKIKCQIFFDGTNYIEDIEGPYCPTHKILLRSDHNHFRCDFDNCHYEIWANEAHNAKTSIKNLASSNPQLLMTEDCEPF